MSFQAMTWAVEQPCTSPGQKLALLMLANHCNGHSGKCIPSHKLLADECSMGVSTLKRHLQVLADKGLLTIIPRSQDGVSMPNQYRLNLEVGRSELDGGVGPNRAGGRSDLGRGVGPNRATNQEVKPGREPESANKSAPTPPKARKASKALSLTDWLAQVAAAGEKAIPDDDPVRSYATKAGIPGDFLLLAWVEFKARYSEPDAKTYTDWRQVFRSAVRGNWLKLWFVNQDGYQLTTTGKQAQQHLERDE